MSVSMSVCMYVSQHFLGTTSFSHRFPPNFDALNPNLKSVFQNSIQGDLRNLWIFVIFWIKGLRRLVKQPFREPKKLMRMQSTFLNMTVKK
jgi:hypothetical protein